MLKAQMWEAIFVAGSVFIAMAGPAIVSNRAAAVVEAKAHFAYELVSSHGNLHCRWAVARRRY